MFKDFLKIFCGSLWEKISISNEVYGTIFGGYLKRNFEKIRYSTSNSDDDVLPDSTSFVLQEAQQKFCPFSFKKHQNRF
jgi:hypothetical protein